MLQKIQCIKVKFFKTSVEIDDSLDFPFNIILFFLGVTYNEVIQPSETSHSPPEVLTPMTTPWPFAQWGLDMMGPLPIG